MFLILIITICVSRMFAMIEDRLCWVLKVKFGQASDELHHTHVLTCWDRACRRSEPAKQFQNHGTWPRWTWAHSFKRVDQRVFFFCSLNESKSDLFWYMFDGWMSGGDDWWEIRKERACRCWIERVQMLNYGKLENSEKRKEKKCWNSCIMTVNIFFFWRFLYSFSST